MRLIDADELLNKTANLEAVALEQVAKCSPSEDPEGWHRWSAIHVERTAFKYDLMDAPTIEAEPIRHGHWIERTKVHPDLLNESTYNYTCSNCGYWDTHGANVEVPYCWHCGAKMDEDK